MKARNKLVALAAVMVLTVSSITINAIPALADEIEESMQIEIENAVSDVSESSVEETNDIETANTESDYIESDSTETEQIESNDAVTEPSNNVIPETVKSNTESRNWSKYEPCNELEISGDKLSGSIIAGKMTKHQPMVIWSKEPLSEAEQKAVWESLKGNPGVGNPSGVVYISGDEASSYGMTVNTTTGKITCDNTSNWSLLYAGEYIRDNPQDSKPETDTTEKVPEQNPEILPNDPEHTPDYIPPQDPEPEKGPGIDVTEEPDNNPKTEDNTPASGSGGGNTSGSGSSSGGGSTGLGSGTTSGSSSGGPGVVHELDDVPETGTLAKLSGRSLDEVPKTGMPEDFAILMAVSVVALILLTVVLVTEMKKERQNNRLNR